LTSFIIADLIVFGCFTDGTELRVPRRRFTGSILLVLITITGCILELVIKVDPSSRLRLTIHEVQVVSLWTNLGVGLRHELALILTL